MTELQIFKFQEIVVNVQEINGKPMFEIYSTGMALGQCKISKGTLYPRKDRIDDNVKNAEIEPVVHNGQQFITQLQLYDLMLEMKTDKIKPFRKWVTQEVLPKISSTGGYVEEKREEEFINNYFPSFSDNTKLSMVQDLTNQNAKLKQQIAELAPITEAYADLMSAQGYLQFIDVASMVEKGRNTLFAFLRNVKVLTKQSSYNVPYGRFRDNGCFKVIYSKTEQGYPKAVTMVSPKGLQYIYKLIKKYNQEDNFDISKLSMEVSA